MPVPPTIDSQDLVGSMAPVPLPQLVGLTETQAREWAADSGFTKVITNDQPTRAMLAPSFRLIIAVENGVVVSAVAG